MDPSIETLGSALVGYRGFRVEAAVPVFPHVEAELPELQNEEGAPPCSGASATDVTVVLILDDGPLGRE